MKGENMKKSYIYVLILLLIIVLGVIIGINLKADNKSEQVSSANVENKIQENKINNTINNEKTNNIAQNTISNTVEQEQNQDIQNEETPKTDLEKAIDIVKKDWGEDSTVYFAEDGRTEKRRIHNMCKRNHNNQCISMVHSRYRNRKI